MRNNDSLTRITCSGIVDADDYSVEDKEYLQNLGIATLPVSEIENIILLPSVSRMIAHHEGLSGDELDTRLNNLSEAIFDSLSTERAVEKVVTRYCRRRIDRLLKKIDLSDSETVQAIAQKYTLETDALNIGNIAQEARSRINKAVENQDLPLLLENYDNKGMMAFAASNLKGCSRSHFENWLVRVLRNGNVQGLIESIREVLPEIEPL
jgi:hypothetical protein